MHGRVRAGLAACPLSLLLLVSCAGAPGSSGSPGSAAPSGAFRPTPGAPFDPPAVVAPERPAAGARPVRVDAVGVDAMGPLQPEVLARVNGESITRGDLAEFLCVNDPRMARMLLDSLVKLRILRAEAARLGVTAPEADVEREMQRVRADLVRAAEAEGKSPESFVQERFGVDDRVYSGMQASNARFVFTRERVVRYTQMLDDCVVGRIIVMPDVEEARRVVDQIRQGADFAEMARRVSVHGTREQGGRLPPVGRWGVHHELEERFFALSPGEVSDPLPVEEDGRQVWVILKCVEFLPARRVSYSEAAAEIARGIEQRPVLEMEVDSWLAAVEKRYKVEYFLRAPAPISAGGEAP